MKGFILWLSLTLWWTMSSLTFMKICNSGCYSIAECFRVGVQTCGRESDRWCTSVSPCMLTVAPPVTLPPTSMSHKTNYYSNIILWCNAEHYEASVSKSEYMEWVTLCLCVYLTCSCENVRMGIVEHSVTGCVESWLARMIFNLPIPVFCKTAWTSDDPVHFSLIILLLYFIWTNTCLHEYSDTQKKRKR